MLSAARPAQAAADKTTIVIVHGASHEDCSEVGPGQTFNYSYDSSKPVVFNIHYHWEKKMIIVAEQKPLMKYKGEYSPKEQHEYCLMWINTNYAPLVLRYTKSVSGR